jgi:uncharacterized phiE125 gp8 family phage protein
MGIAVTVQPSIDPVDVKEAKDHLRILHHDDNKYIKGLITRARMYVENMTARTLITTEYKLTMRDWPGRQIELPHPPVQSVETITTVDPDGNTVVVDSNKYVVADGEEPGFIELKNNEQWPAVADRPYAISIGYTAGYGDERKDVPQLIRHAILELVSLWYEQREPIITGTTVQDVPFSVDSIIKQFQIRRMVY